MSDAADWVARFDQMLRGLADLAKAARSYYEALVEAGFDSEQALALTAHWQSAVLAANSSDN